MNQVASQQKTTPSPSNGAVPAPIAAFQGGRSQATQVEQARAIAEVQAAVLVAHERPRDVTRSTTAMMEAVNIPGMAERSFFSFPRGGQTVSGASVHLARELARCWGNINYGVKELARNDAKGESEMLAFAWDLETNTRNETTFIVPHMRDKKGGPVRLTDMRDIYESNANQGARRVRECIFAVLPKWYTDMAEDGCRKTLEHGGGEPIAQRRASMIAYAESVGVTRAMIEKREGCSADALTSEQLANLKIVFRSLKNGEITKDEAFPETPAEDVTKSLAEKAAQQPKPAPDAGSTQQSSGTAAASAPGQTQAGQAASQPTTTAGPTNTDLVTVILGKIEATSTVKALNNIIEVSFAEDIDLLRTESPDGYQKIQDAIAARRKWFAR